MDQPKYHFVANLILFQKIPGSFSRFCLGKALRRLQAAPAKLPIYLSLAVKGLKTCIVFIFLKKYYPYDGLFSFHSNILSILLEDSPFVYILLKWVILWRPPKLIPAKFNFFLYPPKLIPPNRIRFGG